MSDPQLPVGHLPDISEWAKSLSGSAAHTLSQAVADTIDDRAKCPVVETGKLTNQEQPPVPSVLRPWFDQTIQTLTKGLSHE